MEVHGPGGIGKTALLRAASNAPLPASTPDGVVAVPARLGTADTLSYVFDTCYVGTRRVVPRREELTTALVDLRLLVVLDDTGLSRDDIDALREALPSSLLLLAALEQRVFDGVEGIALGGLTVEEGVDLIRAGVGRELTERERDVGARVSEVLHGTPLELVRFASLVRADEGDLVSVARGFGVDAQPEDLLVAVRRSVSVEEQAVLAALAAFDAPVGAGPVAAFSGYTDAGALLLHLCERGLVQGDDLQGWRVRDRTAAPPEDRQRAATVLATWVRGRSVPEEVAGEIPAIASALEQARQDHRWVDAIALAAAAERPLALAGRWSAWKDTLEAGQAAALKAGDVTSKRFFDHQLGVMDDAMTAVIPVVRRHDGPHREPPPPDDGSGPERTDNTPIPAWTSLGTGDRGRGSDPGPHRGRRGRSRRPLRRRHAGHRDGGDHGHQHRALDGPPDDRSTDRGCTEPPRVHAGQRAGRPGRGQGLRVHRPGAQHADGHPRDRSEHRWCAHGQPERRPGGAGRRHTGLHAWSRGRCAVSSGACGWARPRT